MSFAKSCFSLLAVVALCATSNAAIFGSRSVTRTVVRQPVVRQRVVVQQVVAAPVVVAQPVVAAQFVAPVYSQQFVAPAAVVAPGCNSFFAR